MIDQTQHPIESLFAAMETVAPYPDGVIPVPGRIPGIAFFPGGAGLWDVRPGTPLPPMPMGGVMVLGHDFHSETGFRASMDQGTEVPHVARKGYRTAPTWITLRKLFAEVNVPLTRCFFTNVYMGLRKGSGTTGRFPGSRDVEFVERCRAFLLRQLAAQQPTLVLTLGSWVPAFVAPLAPKLAAWRGARTMKDIDCINPLMMGVAFEDSSLPPCTVLALTHPSLRGPNVGRRQYGSLNGHAAEIAMLRQAMVSAGIS